MAVNATLWVNTSQRRMKQQRIALVAGGRELDGPSENTWRDPLTNTTYLRPAPLYPQWHTTSTGAFARLTLADFGLSGGGWVMHAVKPAGAVRMFNGGGMSGPVESVATWPRNCGFYVSYFAFSAGNQSAQPWFECGWTTVIDEGVQLRFWSDGQVDVYYGADLVGSYGLGNQTGQSQANTYQEVLLIPHRGRELLIYSITSGAAVRHVFGHISESDPDPTITDATKFFWEVPVGTVDVEIAPIVYPESGWVTSETFALAEPPLTGATREQWTNGPIVTFAEVKDVVTGSPAILTNGGRVSAVSVVKPDLSPFVPNGTDKLVRVRCDLARGASQYHTPALYGVALAYEATYVNTSGASAYNLTPHVQSLRWDVPDDPGSVRVLARVRNPESLLASVPNLYNEGIAAELRIGSLVVASLTSVPSRFVDGEHGEVRTLEMEFGDRLHALKNLTSKDRWPLDGRLLTSDTAGSGTYASAVEFLYSMTGLTFGEMQLDSAGFALGSVAPEDCTEWNYLLEAGFNPYDELATLESRFAAGWIWGIGPTATGPKAFFIRPVPIGSPDHILYRDAESAALAGAPESQVYFSFAEEPIPIEANEVRVTGQDRRTGRAIAAYKVDKASQDPSILPSLQAANHLGEPRLLAITDDRLTTQEAVNRVAEFVFPQVSSRFYVAEWDCELILIDAATDYPARRGQAIRLDGRRDVRINSFSAEFMNEDPGLALRIATYTGGTITNAGGLGLREVKAYAERRARPKRVDRVTFASPGQKTTVTAVAIS